MIVVNAVVRTNRESIASMAEAIATMENASRAEEGCNDYTFSVELNDPDALRITERWDTVEHLRAHFQTPHMAAFQSAMAEAADASVEVKFYEVEEIQPF